MREVCKITEVFFQYFWKFTGQMDTLEHSSTTSIFSVFMMTSSNGNMFRATGFCAGNSPVTAGNSPGTGEFPSHRPVTRSFDVSLICAWANGSVNNQDAGDLRRHRAHYDVTVMWCRIVIQWSGQQWDLSAFNAASLLSNFELVKRFKLGVPCIMEGMASNLAHCSTLITIPWN